MAVFGEKSQMKYLLDLQDTVSSSLYGISRMAGGGGPGNNGGTFCIREIENLVFFILERFTKKLLKSNETFIIF